MSTGPAKGRYAVEYKVSVFAYVDMDDPNGYGPQVTKVVVDDENISAPIHIETDNADRMVAMESDEGKAIIEAVDGPDVGWPGWEFGF